MSGSLGQVAGLGLAAASGMGGSASGGSSSTQPYIMSGPTIEAANNAAQAQINAAGQASKAIQQNTQSAINSLMGEYGTAFQIEQPTVALGNQAANQYNYMLGLGAIAPGTAPTAPTAPTLASALGKIKSQDVNQYIGSNIGYGPTNAQGNQEGQGTNTYTDPITGYQYTTNTGTGSLLSGGAFLNSQAQQGGLTSDTQAYKNTAQYLAQQQLEQDQANYDVQNKTYQQQLDAYNMQQKQYDTYNAKGTATATDINSIVNNLPGFQAQQAQGISAIQNAASASGNLNSGNILQQLSQFGQGLSGQYYQNYMGNLASQANLGQSAAQVTANGANTLGSNLASAYTNQGAGMANAYLGAGNALASSYLAPVANQQVSMTPYSTSSSGGSSQGYSATNALGALGSISQSGGFGNILKGLG